MEINEGLDPQGFSQSMPIGSKASYQTQQSPTPKLLIHRIYPSSIFTQVEDFTKDFPPLLPKKVPKN